MHLPEYFLRSLEQASCQRCVHHPYLISVLSPTDKVRTCLTAWYLLRVSQPKTYIMQGCLRLKDGSGADMIAVCTISFVQEI